VPGGEPGLYGGTRDSSQCDPAKLIAFLHENADKAKAWAQTIGIPVSGIDGYVQGLTSVLLRADTRVTNHGFDNGAATAVQSVLEAGTAVLVDKFGVPRVKCYCGNPLLEPEPVKSTPTYTGTTWTGFAPNQIQVVAPAPQPITVIVVVDVDTGKAFGRPVGTDGAADVNAVLPPRTDTSSTTSTTAPASTTSTTRPSSTTTTKGTTTTTSAGGTTQTAVTMMKDALKACAESVSPGSGSAMERLRYTATAKGSGVFSVLVEEPDGGDRGEWLVNTRTGDFTPQDPTSAVVGAICPKLA
jgi:hypothetical protein